jgi:regulator of ribonuclease activity A
MIKTADLSDKHEGKVKAAMPVFRSFGQKKSFHGEIVTVKVFEDNVLVKDMLGKKGTGKVLVVDGGGSLRYALMGDNLAQMAIDNGWEGVIIYGCIRDSADIDKINVGVKALNTIPFKSKKGGEGETNVPVTLASVTFKPGEFVYADEDGILVSETNIAV